MFFSSERRTQGFWDCTQALRNFHNISQLTRCEKNAAFALKNFDTLANGFYDRAQDSNYRSLLTREQAVQLRTEFASLADWILHNKELSILRKHPLEDTIRFQVQRKLLEKLSKCLKTCLSCYRSTCYVCVVTFYSN